MEFSQGNVKTFKNNEDLLNLVEFISRLDCLLSPDTGNVHIADYLRIPTLEIVRESAKRRWQGGGWGGVCECVVLPKGWYEDEEGFAKIFLQRAKDFLIQNLT
ncbi:glycosyltransferase family 9 protein [Helicobacter apodemus]|uniref:glycosyltransferase family 9 protein n=1 Tax=Helicobacter apodemus TaxID=135569 RepID=UPI0013A5301B|nr:glycosyltransferase family 9 protein [Helicobacter apodemus]